MAYKNKNLTLPQRCKAATRTQRSQRG